MEKFGRENMMENSIKNENKKKNVHVAQTYLQIKIGNRGGIIN